MYSKIEFGFVFYRDSKEEEKKITFDEACFASSFVIFFPFFVANTVTPRHDDVAKYQQK